MSSDLLTDNFRMDRFGRVLPEDKQKKAQWEKLFADMAECDEKGAVEIQRRWYQRLSDTKVDVSVTDISNAPVDRKRVV